MTTGVHRGVYNGQTANKAEANDNQHVIARATYPLEWRGQIIEPSVAAYSGEYTLPVDQRTVGVKGHENWTYRDERVVTSLSIAPQPFGLLAEYNVGADQNTIPRATVSRRNHCVVVL